MFSPAPFSGGVGGGGPLTLPDAASDKPTVTFPIATTHAIKITSAGAALIGLLPPLLAVRALHRIVRSAPRAAPTLAVLRLLQLALLCNVIFCAQAILGLLGPLVVYHPLCTAQAVLVQVAVQGSNTFTACLAVELFILVQPRSGGALGEHRLRKYVAATLTLVTVVLITMSVEDILGPMLLSSTTSEHETGAALRKMKQLELLQENAWCWLTRPAYAVYVAAFGPCAVTAGALFAVRSRIANWEGELDGHTAASIRRVARNMMVFPLSQVGVWGPALVVLLVLLVTGVADPVKESNEGPVGGYFYLAATLPLQGLVSSFAVAYVNKRVRAALLCGQCGSTLQGADIVTDGGAGGRGGNGRAELLRDVSLMGGCEVDGQVDENDSIGRARYSKLFGGRASFVGNESLLGKGQRSITGDMEP